MTKKRRNALILYWWPILLQGLQGSIGGEQAEYKTVNCDGLGGGKVSLLCLILSFGCLHWKVLELGSLKWTHHMVILRSTSTILGKKYYFCKLIGLFKMKKCSIYFNVEAWVKSLNYSWFRNDLALYYLLI